MAGRVLLGRLQAGSDEDDTIKVDSNLELNGSVEDGSGNSWGIESGSNANGYYTKFPDGTLICWGETGVISDGGSEAITWPVEFIAKPSVSAVSLTRDGYNVSFGSGGTGSVDVTGGTIHPESGNSNVASWIAIGRWK